MPTIDHNVTVSNVDQAGEAGEAGSVPRVAEMENTNFLLRGILPCGYESNCLISLDIYDV